VLSFVVLVQPALPLLAGCVVLAQPALLLLVDCVVPLLVVV